MNVLQGLIVTGERIRKEGNLTLVEHSFACSCISGRLYWLLIPTYALAIPCKEHEEFVSLLNGLPMEGFVIGIITKEKYEEILGDMKVIA